jgi:hypothetical protein
VILQIDVTVTSPDGTTASGSVAVDVVDQPGSAARRETARDLNEIMRQRSRELRWGGRPA